ncbi:MAG: STAS domain-containing protein [Chlorobi bacterium]|nr:STAS domain-containing protein [Chlorobiota bacterium]
MKYNMKDTLGVNVIEVKGKLEGGPGASEFQDMIASKIDEGNKKFVVDLSDVKFVNSTGIGILIRAYTTLRNGGGDMKLAAISDKVQGVLSITKLDTIFNYFDTVNDAVRSFDE